MVRYLANSNIHVHIPGDILYIMLCRLLARRVQGARVTIHGQRLPQITVHPSHVTMCVCGWGVCTEQQNTHRHCVWVSVGQAIITQHIHSDTYPQYIQA